MKVKPLAFFFAILAFFLLIYLGLNTAERGIREISVPSEPGRVFRISHEGKEIIIIFAGDSYCFPYERYLQKLRRD